LTGLEIALVAAALAAGLTGAWSPCGFSMVETIGPTGHHGGRRLTLAACVTFAAGALAGGAATFASLAWLGSVLHGAGGGIAVIVAAVIAGAAALGEARGARIVPQIRRQVPESWRRIMPLPLASGLYGILLGLGFTTFVLTMAVWALAGVSVALGDPRIGLLIGLAFGAGRALPVIALAPGIDRERSIRLAELMAERPSILRGFRLADAGLLTLCLVLLLSGGAQAATPAVTPPAADPAAAGGALAWQRPGGGAASLSEGGQTRSLPGRDPAVGGGHAAVRNGNEVTVLRRDTFELVTRIRVTGAGPLAVSDRWLVVHARTTRSDRLVAMELVPGASPRTIARRNAPVQLGRPALEGSIAVWHLAGRTVSRIVERDLSTGRTRTLRSGQRVQFSNPSLEGVHMAFVRAAPRAQELRVARRGIGTREQVLYGLPGTAFADSGVEPGRLPHTLSGRRPPRTSLTLWTTALGPSDAYVTRLHPVRGNGPPTATILRLPRP
jgi:hypothetical protein